MTAMSKQAEPLRRADGGPVRVLVVDDEATLSELLSMALRYEGWEVRSAADGGQAVRAAREFRPDAVVLDVMLPGLDGTEVFRRLRADEALASVPVVFLSARSRDDDLVQTDDLDAIYVTKPFDPSALVETVRDLIGRGAA